MAGIFFPDTQDIALEFGHSLPLSVQMSSSDADDASLAGKDDITLWSRLRVLDPRNVQSMQTSWESYKVRPV